MTNFTENCDQHLNRGYWFLIGCKAFLIDLVIFARSVCISEAAEALNIMTDVSLATVWVLGLSSLIVNWIFATTLRRGHRQLGKPACIYIINMLLSNVIFTMSVLAEFMIILSHWPVNCAHSIHKPSDQSAAYYLINVQLKASKFLRPRVIVALEAVISSAQGSSLITFLALLFMILRILGQQKLIRKPKSSIPIVLCICAWLVPLAGNSAVLTTQLFSFEMLQRYSADRIQCIQAYQEIQNGLDTVRKSVWIPPMFTCILLAAGLLTYSVIACVVQKRVREQEVLFEKISSPLNLQTLFMTITFSLGVYYISTFIQSVVELTAISKVLQWSDEPLQNTSDKTQFMQNIQITSVIARLLAFCDPIINPLIVIWRTKQLRQTLFTRLDSTTVSHGKALSSPLKECQPMLPSIPQRTYSTPLAVVIDYTIHVERNYQC